MRDRTEGGIMVGAVLMTVGVTEGLWEGLRGVGTEWTWGFEIVWLMWCNGYLFALKISVLGGETGYR